MSSRFVHLNSSTRRSSSAVTRTASPTGTGTPAGAARRPRTTYPEALPSALSQKYDGPVTGTAVIDREYAAIDILVEIVTPDATPLQDPLTHEFLMDCAEEMEERCHETLGGRGGGGGDCHEVCGDDSGLEGTGTNSCGSANQLRRNANSFTEGGAHSPVGVDDELANASFVARRSRFMERASRRASHASGLCDGSSASLTRAGDSSIPGDRPHITTTTTSGSTTRRVLKEGGYVIFSDEYLQAHPSSTLTSIALEFRLANPVTTPAPPLDPKLDDKKRKVEHIKQLIREAEGQHRPLFRRRPAELVYGEARYLPRSCEDLEAQSHAAAGDDMDGNVYMAGSPPGTPDRPRASTRSKTDFAAIGCNGGGGGSGIEDSSSSNGGGSGSKRVNSLGIHRPPPLQPPAHA